MTPHRRSAGPRRFVSFASIALLAAVVVSSGACARSEFSPDDGSAGEGGSSTAAGTGGSASGTGGSGTAGKGGTSSAGTGGSNTAGTGGSDTAGTGGTGGSGTAGKGGTGGSGTAGKGGTGGSGATGKGCVLVINELCPQGASGTDQATDEYIELYNAGDTTCDVEGWSLKYRSDKNGAGGNLWLGEAGDTVGSGQFFVVAGPNFGGSSDADYAGSSSMSKDGGGVALVDDGDTVIDSIAYGSATSDNDYAEGDVAPKISIGSCLSRTPDGNDSDDNGQDFVETDPTPGASN